MDNRVMDGREPPDTATRPNHGGPSLQRIDGLELLVPPGLLRPYHVHAIARGTYEAEEMALSDQVVRHGDRIIEFGSGIGLVTRHLARLSPGRRVLACEPNPAAAGVARHHLAAAGLEVALREVLVVPAGGSGAGYAVDSDNFLASGAEGSADGTAGGETAGGGTAGGGVATVTLPDLIAEWDPSCLVVDAEGAELGLFQDQALDRLRAVVIEMHPQVTGFEATLDLARGFYRGGLVLVPDLIAGQTMVFVRPGTTDLALADTATGRAAALRGMQLTLRAARARAERRNAAALRFLTEAQAVLPGNPFVALDMAITAGAGAGAGETAPLLDLAARSPATQRHALQTMAEQALARRSPAAALEVLQGSAWGARAYERHLAARALLALHRPAEALAEAEAAVAAAPGLFAAQNVRVQAATAAGAPEVARAAVAAARAIDPGNPALAGMPAAT